MSNAMPPWSLYRLANQAQGETESADTQLALTPYEYGTMPANINPPSNPTHQDRAPAAQRLASPQWNGKTSTLNHAQAAQDRSNVWVTVPVDKVETRAGSSSVTPMYQTPTGYVPRPGESRGSIPPGMPVGRPY